MAKTTPQSTNVNKSDESKRSAEADMQEREEFLADWESRLEAREQKAEESQGDGNQIGELAKAITAGIAGAAPARGFNPVQPSGKTVHVKRGDALIYCCRKGGGENYMGGWFLLGHPETVKPAEHLGRDFPIVGIANRDYTYDEAQGIQYHNLNFRRWWRWLKTGGPTLDRRNPEGLPKSEVEIPKVGFEQQGLQTTMGGGPTFG